MVEAFLERGYAVDVIDSTNHAFTPTKQYSFFVDNAENMERLSSLLGTQCKKIVHITNAEPAFQNKAGSRRAEDLKVRRGITLTPDRNIPESHAIEIADYATVLGNQFTSGTYEYANKPLIRIPISNTHSFPAPETKDFDVVRKHFIWLGGAGPLHKGLDLVLEAFSSMPDYKLVVCAKLAPTDPFAEAFKKELYETPTIKMLGFVDPSSDQFKKLCDESLGIVSVSCSEGGGGGVILGMHAGLIPVVNYETSVDVGDFGVLLPGSRIETLQNAVRELSILPTDQLKTRALRTWKYVRENHTRERFAKEYRVFLDTLNA
jgi:glycosyltransferase involved in cell wall biosynthesis